MPLVKEQASPAQGVRVKHDTWLVLSLAGLSCTVQLAWFWRIAHRNINADAISYIGIARHLMRGEFHDSLNGLWSPLISWLIAIASPLTGNLTFLARALNIVLLLGCLALIYLLTLRLWGSMRLAALAVLWFTLARGVVSFSVTFIGADLLLTLCTTAYFIQLLQCLRSSSLRGWTLLGVFHGFAFLAKAFAMPWLMCSTLIAGFFVCRRSRKNALLPVSVGVLIPCLFWLGWGRALQTKYGVFTAGYQSRFHLQRAAMAASGNADQSLRVLQDLSKSIDRFGVWDPMFPGSSLWGVRASTRQLAPELLHRETQNIPAAIKQLAIFLTPGGLLALALSLWGLWDTKGTEMQFLVIVLCSTAALIVGYAMLMFTGRYLLPCVPPLIAVAVAFLIPGWGPAFPVKSAPKVQFIACALLLIGAVYFQVYWASPLREFRRDYELACYDAAAQLRREGCGKVVSIGAGPFPAQGMGWEAGMYTTYFADCRVTAASAEIPSGSKLPALIDDIRSLEPDSLLIWGVPSSPEYAKLLQALQASDSGLQSNAILDPQLGEIGRMLLKPAASR